MGNTASLKKEYAERIAPALMKQFNYTSAMQIPVLKKIVINQGLGMATANRKSLMWLLMKFRLSQARKQWLLFQRKTLQTSNCVKRCQSV